MRATRDLEGATPHDADSIAAMSSVRTERHMIVKA
jgi:hypothetical protein